MMASSYGYIPSHAASTASYMPYANGGIPKANNMNEHSLYNGGGAGSPGSYGMFHGPGNGPGFSFRKRFERVDWRKIAAVDIDNIARNLDFHTLQDNISNITYCNIEAELDVRTIDPNFVKLFRIAQLTIEYLLHCQDYLSGMVSGLEEKLKKAIEEHEQTKRVLDKQNIDIGEIKKESHKRKKMLAAQQQIIHAGANSYNKCPFCSKAFVNATFLQSHLQRRHADNINGQYAGSGVTPAHQVAVASQPGLSGTALEGELKEIKERLKLTESQLQDERAALDSIRRKEQSESLRLEEMNKKQLEAWKKEQMEQHHTEIERVKAMFMKELKEMGNKYAVSERALQEMQQRSGHRGSNLGMLHDDLEYERTELQQQREEVAMLKEQLQQQMGSVESLVKVKFDESEKKWKSKMKELNKQHEEEKKELSDAFKQNHASERRARNEAADEQETQIQELIKLSQDQERRLLDQEKQIQLMSQQPPAVTPRQSQPSVPTLPERQERQVSHDQIQPIRREKSPMYSNKSVTRKSADNEDEDDEEDEDEESGVEESTLGTTRDSTMDRSSADLTLTSRTMRVYEQMKSNPHLLNGLKEELRSLLDSKLEHRGIHKGATGIPSNVLNTQLTMLKTERQQLAKKNQNFYDIRAQYNAQIEQKARDRLKGTIRSDASHRSSTSTKAEVSTPQKASSQKPSSRQPPQAQPPQAPRISSTPPKPAPRSLSPTQQARLSQTMSTTGSLGDSSKWESDNYEDDSEDDDDDSYSAHFPKKATPESPQKKSSSATSSPAKPSPRQRTASPRSQAQQPSPRQRTASPRTHSIPHAQNEEESEWDSASELMEIPSQNHVTNKPSSVPQPNGSVVRELTRSIEMQLQSRTGESKPTGGVNTLPSETQKARAKPTNAADDEDDDDLDDWDDDTVSVSSLENHQLRDVGRKLTNRSSHGDTDHSNTYGTSVWGGSSKAASTVNPGTVGKSSVSVTDWDSDLDEFNDIPIKGTKPEITSRSKNRTQ